MSPERSKVPFPMFDKTKCEIDRMLQMGVISKVEQHTEWCSPMVVTPKPNGDVRVCVDLTRLRLLHTMNVRFSLLDIAQRILGVTLPNFQ